IGRLGTPARLVVSCGARRIEVAGGVDRDGQARAPRRFVMSRRGNDLVRRYLWMAALSALRCNPAVRALYARVVAKHPQEKAIAVGHAMRKLLHLVFAVWKTGQPFAPQHYPWQTPAHVEGSDPGNTPRREPRDPERPVAEQAAGHQPDALPAGSVVTAACPDSVAEARSVGEGLFVDFAHLKRQLSLAAVLDHLGLTARLRGRGPQR